MKQLRTATVVLFLTYIASAAAEERGTAELVQTIRSVGVKGQNAQAAAVAWRELAQAEAGALPQILAGMEGANPLAENYLRAAVDAIASRTAQTGGDLPQEELEAFLVDSAHSPKARQAAFDWIARTDPAAAQRLIPTFINDRSMELRRKAVAEVLSRAEKSTQDGEAAQARAAYEAALDAARDDDQIKQAHAALQKLGVNVDLAEHYGFIQHWRLIGPFDNTKTAGFDVAYPPEKEINLTATYEGKNGPAAWIQHESEHAFGEVDLNKALGKHMGAVGYAYAEFVTNAPREVEIRYGCINANKLFLNGELLSSNHVYHANTSIDQYVGRGRLRAGVNQILLKVAQNEQTDEWAQGWQFQLRVCDAAGTAILSQGRRPATPASVR